MARSERSPYPGQEDPVSEQRLVGEAVDIKLRYRHALITLRSGKLYLGRSPECDLAISDPAVSRRHARSWVSSTQIVIEDLGSQNGVHVNGTRIRGRCELRAGDVLRICSHEMQLVNAFEEAVVEPNRYRITLDTLSGVDQSTLLERMHPASRPPPPSLRASVHSEVRSRPSTAQPSSDSLANSIVLLDEALDVGNVSEAELRLGPILMQVHQLLLEGHPGGLELAEHVVVSAARLAGATRSAGFMSYAVALYQLLGRPLPESALNVIHALVQASSYPNMSALESYVAKISTHTEHFDATELFLLASLRRVVTRR